MAKNIEVKGTNVTILAKDEGDYISLTDIAHYKEPGRTDHVIQNWIRNRNTVEFLGIWELLNNPNFKPLEFEGFKKRAGLNSFILTAKRCLSVKAYIKGKDCLSLIKLPSSR